VSDVPLSESEHGFVRLADHSKLNADQIVEELPPKVSQIAPGCWCSFLARRRCVAALPFHQAHLPVHAVSAHISKLCHYAPILESEMRAAKILPTSTAT
jgi:hypothetical protein